MKHFQRMIETACKIKSFIKLENRITGAFRNQVELNFEDAYSMSSEDTPDIFFQYLEECQPFVFDESILSFEKLTNLIESEPYTNSKPISFENFDSPFRVFSVELNKGDNLDTNPPEPIKQSIDSKTLGLKIDVLLDSKFPCLIFIETQPKCFECYVLNSTYVHKIKDADKPFVTYDILQCSKSVIDNYLPLIINSINKDYKGIEKTRSFFKLKNKRTRRINTVIHITRNKDNYIKTSNIKNIDFSHRFLVRGHWRKLSDDGLGKNRAGEYCVNGMTWVSEFEKGDKDKPLIKKTRMVMT